MTDPIRAAYDANAEAYAAAFPGTEPEQDLDLAVIDHFVGLLGEHPEVLDAGCGTGRMGRYLTDRGCRVRGIDLSPGMLAIARREQPDLVVDEGSVTALPYADAAFDGVLAWYSTIYLSEPDVARALAEARRVLRPAGLLLVGFQSGHGAVDVSAAFGVDDDDARVIRHNRTADTMAELAAAHGFSEQARVVRAAAGGEREPQAFLVARAITGSR